MFESVGSRMDGGVGGIGGIGGDVFRHVWEECIETRGKAREAGLQPTLLPAHTKPVLSEALNSQTSPNSDFSHFP